MGLTSPLSNLKGFATSRPPLVVFTICLSVFSLTTVSLAYFIRYSGKIPNQDFHVDWNRFLKHLSSYELCALPDTTSNSTRTVDEEQNDSVGNVSITVTASLSLVQQLSPLQHNITTVAGFLPLGAWSSMCKTESLVGEGAALNMSLTLPQNLSQADDVCVTFVGPRSLLPVVSTSPACTPVAPQQGLLGRMLGRSRDAEVLGERDDDDWCKGGTVMRLVYRSSPQLTVLLTGSDRSLINLHLIHTSYFLFVMAMTLVCYAIIKGKPKQKNILVDKVQLDP
ncbi:transmembrane protein 248-like [Zootermopsis nevadensis]|uniref:transmembrane protein 248-like n=1 Tax=Zootermopsis nevadensis TaxID=136037 RepID=UPI000B8E44C7|nr:transmembrane protein 248-like [Zootermopsis nevadensis]